MSKGSKNVARANKGSSKGTRTRPVVIESPKRNDGKTGRVIGKIIDTTNPDVLRREIANLLNELRESQSRNDKKRIRRLLRTRGHFGGLGIRDAQRNASNDAGE